MQVEVSEAKAPYVMFEKRAVEDRQASITNGCYTTKDVDYVMITPAGSRDRIERVAEEWFAMMEKAVKNNRFPVEWLRAYRMMYKEWQEGNEIPVLGTPIKTWPVASPAQRRNLLEMKVMTVEVLADANEEIIGRLGMGGRALKAQAKAWLESAKDVGQVSEQFVAMQAKLDAQAQMIATLQEQLARLTPAPAPRGTDRLEAASDEDDTSDDLFTSPKRTKL